MCEWLDPMGVQCKVVEIRELIDCLSLDVHMCHIIKLASSSGLTNSGCLLAICFSTKAVALKSF